MNIPIAECSRQQAAGIQNVLSLCTVDANSVLVACHGTTDLFLLAIDNSIIEIEYIYAVNLRTPARKLRHISALDATFILSDGKLYSTSLKRERMILFQAILPVIDAVVTDFDVVIVREGACISVLEASDVSVFIYTRNGKFLLSRFKVANISACNWVTPDCLCCSGERMLHIYGVDGTYMLSLGSHTTPAHYAIPLPECFLPSDKMSDANNGKKSFVVFFEGCNLYFAYYLVLFVQVGDVFTETLRFPVFTSSLPACVFSVGPWVCVGGLFGLEFYDYRTGSYVQSSLETESYGSYSFANISLDATLVPNDKLYSRPRFGMFVAKNTLHTICLRPILDIVEELKDDAAFYMGLLESLKKFGESVQAINISQSHSRCDTISTTNMFFSDYGSILAGFRVSLWEFKPENNAMKDKKKRGSVCAICGLGALFSLQFCECLLCHSIVCRKCSCARCLRLYGYDNVGSKSIICTQCDGRCDLNLYRLFMSRRYKQIIYYIEEYPERCHKLSISEVISSILPQCFVEKKFDLCAELIEKCIPKHDVMWDQWVFRFGLQKHIGCLARVYNPNYSDETINTGFLLQLVKYGSYDLNSLLQHWPLMSYSAKTVLSGILARLSFKKQEACDLQLSCQIETLTFVEWQNAVSELYFDDDVNYLLRSYLHICFKNKNIWMLQKVIWSILL
ncbi:putative vacuolar protein sorting-associated protein 41 [Trypanosoma rangeli]|uniref:Putative vacuolar protein sorting-associated protein 41 n=1 Tax=Trypanosoma rangeli TaxID=5698 RepID=A0A422N9D4_TRYRA|nr:putative vacuolar protein sorting-associated protein 41 [Trypanosoma rangeli]RNF02046.1 putative vacuolar protein sorting-associated protein 41 [Trypanosoma rangeli]|eukprot:RNF02046.1 putative vacuolar protein sorting-associated protein 41 [Trypanosoma rangeli]